METRRAIVMLGLFFLVAGVCYAQHNNTSVQQQIIVEVKPITSINVTGNPHSFLIQDPPQGPNSPNRTIIARHIMYLQILIT